MRTVMLTVSKVMQDMQDTVDTGGNVYAEWAIEALGRGGIPALQAEYDFARALPRPSHLRLFVYQVALFAAREAERAASSVTPSPVTEN